MAERGMARIICSRRGLHHDMIKTAEIMKQIMILGAE